MRIGRIGRIGQVPTWVVAVGAAAAWAASAAVVARYGAAWHLDLRVYRAAGQSLLHGGAPFRQTFTASRLPFTYPPVALLALTPLALGRLGTVEALWWAVNAAALVAVVHLVVRQVSGMGARRCLAVAALVGGVATLALEPVRSDLDFGQVNLLLMLAVVYDLTRARPPWRGVLVGAAAAVKLTPLVYLAWFLVTGDRRSLGRGVATFAGLTGLAWAVLPSASTLYWFHEATDAARTGPLASVSNQSWNGLLHRPPFAGGAVGTVLWAVLAVATLACGLAVARRLLDGSRPVEALVALALTELLVSPVSWTHHWSWLVLAPVAAVAAARHSNVPVARALAVLVALAVAAPYWWLTAPGVSAVAGNALVLAGAAVLATWAVTTARAPRPGTAGGGRGAATPRRRPVGDT